MLLLAAKTRLELDRKGSASHTEKHKHHARLMPPNQSHSHTVVAFVVIDVAAGREAHTICNEERHHHAYDRSLTNHRDEATKTKHAKFKSALPNSHGAEAVIISKPTTAGSIILHVCADDDCTRRASRYLHAGRHGWIHKATGRY